MRKAVVLLALVSLAGFVSAAWYTQIKPGVVAGEDSDIFYTCVDLSTCGGVSVYAVGQWQLPPIYPQRTLVLHNHAVVPEGSGLYYRYDIWWSVLEVGTKAYGTVGMFGEWVTFFF